MLILGRRANEAVTLTTEDGQKMRVVVLEVKRNFVRLGFEADPTVSVVRDELFARDRKKDV